MPNIVPVSDLRNYNAVIGQVSYGNPVYLTQNGRGDCAIIDIRELDELRAIKGLFSELGKGEASARKARFEPGFLCKKQLYYSYLRSTSTQSSEMIS